MENFWSCMEWWWVTKKVRIFGCVVIIIFIIQYYLITCCFCSLQIFIVGLMVGDGVSSWSKNNCAFSGLLCHNMSKQCQNFNYKISKLGNIKNFTQITDGSFCKFFHFRIFKVVCLEQYRPLFDQPSVYSLMVKIWKSTRCRISLLLKLTFNFMLTL